MTDENPEVAKTKATFDLSERLKNRGLRSGSIKIYTDEVTGAELGAADDIKNSWGVTTGRRQTGVLGEIDRLDKESPTYDQDLARLNTEAARLKAILDETALTFNLRAVPPVIAKDAKRRARASLNIKGKVDDDRIEEFNESFTAHLLSDTITSVEDADGNENGKQTYEQCLELLRYLPASEFNRLDGKLSEIQFADAVSAEYIETADF